MKKIITLFFIAFIISGLYAGTDTTVCNWKSRISRFDVYNNCDSHKNTVNIIGKIGLYQLKNCTKPVKRVWKLSSSTGSSVIGTGENLYYKVTKNGTYTICLSLYDSCNNCDTVICKSVVVSCLGCNWKSKVNDFHVTGNCDSTSRSGVRISGMFILNNKYTCTKGKKWKWVINNSVVSTSSKLYYPVSQNGTYNVCLWLYDSCNNCDTSFCKTVTINCVPGCNWKSKVNDFHVTNNCDSSNRHGVNISGMFILNKNYTCTKGKKWKWILNGAVISTSPKLYYKVEKNGTYNICLWLYDSCNNCDTSFCKTVTINCFPGCNWKSKVNDFHVTNNCDSSNRHGVNISGMFILNKNYTCTKGKRWKWSVNNTIVSTSEKLYYKVEKNGTYNVCLWLYDSCNNCDTSFCKTVTINCFPGCNWKSKVNDFHVTSNCDSSNRHGVNISGMFILNKNYTCTKGKKWKWILNGAVISTSPKLYYKVEKNGTYNVCLWLYDSCNNCDTSFCKTVTINCIPGCNWKSKVNDFHVTNNCDSTHRTGIRISGMFILNKNYTCTKGKKWKWTVNNSVVSTSSKLYYPVTQNGTYNVCLWLYDSCNNCDTSFCKTITINCAKGCNWKSKVNDFHVTSNCDSTNRTGIRLSGMFILNKNYTCTKGKKWKWTVNGAVVSTSPKLYYKVEKNGNYNVCLWLYDSCNNCDTSFCKTVEVRCGTLSAEELHTAADVHLYPNPAQDNVNITFEQADISSLDLSILDLSGRVITELKQMKNENGTCSIDIRQLPPGMYLVRVNMDQRVVHLTLVKN